MLYSLIGHIHYGLIFGASIVAPKHETPGVIREGVTIPKERNSQNPSGMGRIGINKRELESRLDRFQSEALIHLDAMLRAAGSMARGSGDAEDIVQETFLRAWKYFDSFEAGTNCRGWLFGIMFNVINAMRGKQSKIPETPLEEHGSPCVQLSNVVAFDPLRQIEGREVLGIANELSEEHRGVLQLVVIEEFSYHEAASILGVPIGTVMSRLHRARRELRKRSLRTNADGATG